MNITILLLVVIVGLIFIMTSFSRVRKAIRYLREQDSQSQPYSRINAAVYGQIIVGILLIILWFVLIAVILTNSISRLVN